MKLVSRIKNFYQQHRNRVLSAPIIITSLILLLSIIVALHSWQEAGSQQNKRMMFVLRKLSNIQSDINLFSKSLNQKEQKMMLDKIERSLDQTKQSIEPLAKMSDIKNISSQLASAQTEVDKRISELQETIKNPDNKQYLNSNVLPFHVITVDVIAGQPYVSIDTNGLILPLSISDSMSGWRLIAADFETGFAEFMNEKMQYVKINI